MGSHAPPPSILSGLIAEQYAVALDRLIPGAGGGLPAFAATDRRSGRGDLMAVRVQPHRPPRARALNVLAGVSPDGVLGPLGARRHPRRARGGGVFRHLPGAAGAALSEGLGPWPESTLFDKVLRPAVLALLAIEKRGATHRSIRINNMFRGAARGQVVLGAAWAAPPASLQPALYEPPYSAMCLPCGRGEGSVADDVDALGVALIVLALGRNPLAGLDEAVVLERKLALGSYEALVDGERLPSAIGDLVRGMLAEDPEHRPAPALLADPASVRGRRVAARPRRRAQGPLELGGFEAWDARVLAFAIARQPENALPAIKSGALDRWLRRSLGDVILAARLDEAAREQTADPPPKEARPEATLAARLVALLDPLAPLCWQGVAWWPDGLGPALAAAQAGDPQLAGKLGESLSVEAASAWAAVRRERCDEGLLRAEARQIGRCCGNEARPGGSTGSSTRSIRCSPAAVPCCTTARSPASPISCPRSRRSRPRLTATPHLRSIRTPSPSSRPGASCGWTAASRAASSRRTGPLMPMRVLARLQAQLRPGPLPGLGAWLAVQAEPVLAGLRNRTRRVFVQERLQTLAGAGQLQDMLALIDDRASREADARKQLKRPAHSPGSTENWARSPQVRVPGPSWRAASVRSSPQPPGWPPWSPCCWRPRSHEGARGRPSRRPET